MDRYRNEIKYLLSDASLQIVESKVSPILKRDAHTQENGKYSIRSLYFDDYNNSCFFDNENGTDPREKFRIRIYNADTKRITLELKKKECGMTFKESCPISLEECEKILDGTISFPENVDELKARPLFNKFLIQYNTRMLRPKIIVEYERKPFIYGPGNVRITFDMNIGGSTKVKDFLKEKVDLRPILPVGMQMLEVKFDEFLPDAIKQNLQLGTLRQTSFSKFYYCRKYCGLGE